jgi:hypothetical protein
MAGVTTSTKVPPTSNNGPIVERGESRSAAAPPDQAPRAIAVRASPITAVFVSSVIPTYGAMSRSDVISRTRTAADVPNTRAYATHVAKGRVAAPGNGPGCLGEAALSAEVGSTVGSPAGIPKYA